AIQDAWGAGYLDGPMKPDFLEIADDRLTEQIGLLPHQVSDFDTIPRRMIENLRSRVLNAQQDADTYVNKFIAHVATPGSRAHDDAEQLSFTLGQLYKSHRVMCEVTGFL